MIQGFQCKASCASSSLLFLVPVSQYITTWNENFPVSRQCRAVVALAVAVALVDDYEAA